MRIGTQYFKELMDRFGGAHFALASYNAGEARVATWLKERRDCPQDEFIDRHPVRGDADLREAHSRDRGGLPTALRRRHPDAGEHAAGDAAAHRLRWMSMMCAAGLSGPRGGP